MSCTSYGGAIVCQPTLGGAMQRQKSECLGACADGHLSMVVMRERSPYYGPDWYCVECGDMWSSEGRYPRPFERAWRKKAIAKHEQMWEAACWCPVQRDDEHYALPCGKHTVVGDV